MATASTYLEDLFSTEVLRWRYSKALGFSILIQCLLSTLLCNLFSILVVKGSLSPFAWLSCLFHGITNPSWVIYLLLPVMCYIILIRIHIRSYAVHWWILERRLQYVTQLLSFEKLICSLLMVISSCVLLRHYASLVHTKFAEMTVPCNNGQDHCINHQAMIMIFAGFIFGCRLAYKYFVSNYGVISFAVAEPNYLVRLKSKLRLRTALEACALYDIGFWLIFVVICGYLLLALSNILNSTMIISPLQSNHVVEMFYMVFEIRQILTLTFCLVLLAFNIHTFFLSFSEIITQKIEIPVSLDESSDNITQSAHGSNAWILSNALVSSCSLLQLLALKQIKDFSEDASPWGCYYRDKVFTISQPGGHPRNWQSILNPSLNLIRKFTDRLKVNNCIEEKSPTFSSHAVTDVKLQSKFSIHQKLNEFFQSLKQYPLLCYLLSDLPDAKNRQIFAESQSVIWAIQGLSNLVSASYTDDQYGVVQRNVGDILITLTQLQQVLDKVGRGIPTRRACTGTNFGSRSQKYPHDFQLRRALRLTVKSSLYTITSTFKDSIRDIMLPEDARAKMESYLAFEEG